MNNLQQPGVASSVTGLGQKLRVARQQKGLTEAEVAGHLLLGKNVIVGLENDDYSSIIAEVYARGYLRAYAQFLQLPIDDILTDFNARGFYPKNKSQGVAIHASNNKSLPPMGSLIKRQKIHRASTLLIAIIAGVVILGAFGYWLLVSDTTKAVSPPSAPPTLATQPIATPLTTPTAVAPTVKPTVKATKESSSKDKSKSLTNNNDVPKDDSVQKQPIALPKSDEETIDSSDE